MAKKLIDIKRYFSLSKHSTKNELRNTIHRKIIKRVKLDEELTSLIETRDFNIYEKADVYITNLDVEDKRFHKLNIYVKLEQNIKKVADKFSGRVLMSTKKKVTLTTLSLSMVAALGVGLFFIFKDNVKEEIFDWNNEFDRIRIVELSDEDKIITPEGETLHKEFSSPTGSLNMNVFEDFEYERFKEGVDMQLEFDYLVTIDGILSSGLEIELAYFQDYYFFEETSSTIHERKFNEMLLFSLNNTLSTPTTFKLDYKSGRIRWFEGDSFDGKWDYFQLGEFSKLNDSYIEKEYFINIWSIFEPHIENLIINLSNYD